MRLEVIVTGLHRPQGDVAQRIGGVYQFEDLEVNVALNEARTARLRVSMFDPIVQHISAFDRMLKIYYYDKLVFWGVITEPQFELSTKSCLITAMDVSARLRCQFVRYGDPAEAKSTDNGFEGQIPVDYRGLRMLVDCGRNFAEQDARNDPNLGVEEGSPNTTSAHQRITVERGTEVWATMVDVANHIPGPDFELRPVENWPFYCRLNCFDKQGSDKSDEIVFHAGFGRDNLDEMTWTPGGQIVTHAHVLDAEGKYRETRASLPSVQRYGAHVYWDATQYKIRKKSVEADLDVLRAKGDEILDAYAFPPDYHTIKPRLDSGYVYGRDYAIGDYITSAIRVGHVRHEMVGRVIEVKLEQEEQTGLVRENITVIPDVSDEV